MTHVCYCRGQTDTFNIQSSNVGELETVILGHFPREDVPFDKDGQAERENQWYCQEVTITDTFDGTKYRAVIMDS